MSLKKTVDIDSFDKEAFAQWIKSFDVVLSDCDGNKKKFSFKTNKFEQNKIETWKLNFRSFVASRSFIRRN